MKEFGKRYFKDTIYINFDNNEVMKNVFEIDFDISRIISAIKIEYGKNFEVANTLIHNMQLLQLGHYLVLHFIKEHLFR